MNKLNIFDAVRQNNIGRVKKLFKSGISINQKSIGGNTPLMIAILCHHNEIALFLIKNGAKINNIDNDDNNVLICAAKFKNITIANEILELYYLIDINKQNKFGSTALICACYSNDYQMVQLLLFYGANPTITDNRKMSCLNIAKYFNYIHIIAILKTVVNYNEIVLK